MTVREHLILECDLKNIPYDEVEDTIQETLRIVMLIENQNDFVKNLSNGMKRKLSLGMALVAKPKLIILDEPTSGLDVESRRQVWELIKKIKQGRSIIMSSQHLEEADHLSDRILILTRGKFLSLNQPQKIKEQFGVGYKLMIQPQTHIITMEQFKHLKQNIDKAIFNGECTIPSLRESKDSTSKKLIY